MLAKFKHLEENLVFEAVMKQLRQLKQEKNSSTDQDKWAHPYFFCISGELSHDN